MSRPPNTIAEAVDRIRSTTGSRADAVRQTAYRMGRLIAAGRYTRSAVEQSLLRAGQEVGLTTSQAQRQVRRGLTDGEAEGPPPAADPGRRGGTPRPMTAVTICDWRAATSAGASPAARMIIDHIAAHAYESGVDRWDVTLRVLGARAGTTAETVRQVLSVLSGRGLVASWPGGLAVRAVCSPPPDTRHDCMSDIEQIAVNAWSAAIDGVDTEPGRVSPTVWALARALADACGPQTDGAAARAAGISPSTARRVLGRMAEASVIIRLAGRPRQWVLAGSPGDIAAARGTADALEFRLAAAEVAEAEHRRDRMRWALAGRMRHDPADDTVLRAAGVAQWAIDTVDATIAAIDLGDARDEADSPVLLVGSLAGPPHGWPADTVGQRAGIRAAARFTLARAAERIHPAPYIATPPPATSDAEDLAILRWLGVADAVAEFTAAAERLQTAAPVQEETMSARTQVTVTATAPTLAEAEAALGREPAPAIQVDPRPTAASVARLADRRGPNLRVVR